MRKEYDFSIAVPNPYTAKLKKQISIRLDQSVIEYFKSLAKDFDMPYQNLINLYLKECMSDKKKPKLKWEKERGVTEVGEYGDVVVSVVGRHLCPSLLLPTST
jgi:hypothetical protein